MLRSVCPLKVQAHGVQAMSTNTHSLVLQGWEEAGAITIKAAPGGTFAVHTSMLPGGFLPLTVNGRHFKMSVVPGL